MHPVETFQRRHGGDDGDHHSSDSRVTGHRGKTRKLEVSSYISDIRHDAETRHDADKRMHLQSQKNELKRGSFSETSSEMSSLY